MFKLTMKDNGRTVVLYGPVLQLLIGELEKEYSSITAEVLDSSVTAEVLDMNTHVEYGPIPNANSWDGDRVVGAAPHNFSIRKRISVSRRDGMGSRGSTPPDQNHRQHSRTLPKRGGVRVWDF